MVLSLSFTMKRTPSGASLEDLSLGHQRQQGDPDVGLRQPAANTSIKVSYSNPSGSNNRLVDGSGNGPGHLQ